MKKTQSITIADTMSAPKYGPSFLGMRKFDPELFPEERLGPFGYAKLTTAQQNRLKAEWQELTTEFPLAFFTAREAAVLAKVSVNEIHKLAKAGILERRLFQSQNWIEPDSLLAYIVETRRELESV